MHAMTTPAMAPEFDDDAESALVSCGKGVPEDLGEDKVDEKWINGT